MSIDWELFGVKIAMTVGIFFVGIGFGLSPNLTNRIPVIVRTRVLGLFNSLAAGIFLAAGLVHLFSESIELFSNLYPDFHLINPAFLLAPVGFFLTFLIDKVLFLKEDPHGKEVEYTKKHRHKEVTNSYQEIDEGDHVHVKHEYSGHGHSHGLSFSEDGRPSISNYVLVAVLSFHSILAGFVIGLEDELSSVVLVFLALVSHHWIESFALGVNLLRASVHLKPMALLILFFSIMAPLGIIIGMVLNTIMDSQSGEILEAYTIAIAAGSFMYVAIVDILVEEFLITRDKWGKTLFLVIGFLLEATVVIIFEELAHKEDEHNH